MLDSNIQGDIEPTNDQVAKIIAKHNQAEGGQEGGFRNAIRNESLKWPDAKIPYIISSDYSNEDRALIAKAMDGYHKNTCIR